MAEITLNIILYKRPETFRQFYFNADILVKNARKEICAAFDSELDPEKNFLHRVDAFEEPSYVVRRLNATFH